MLPGERQLQSTPSTTFRFEVSEEDFDQSRDYSLSEILSLRVEGGIRGSKINYYDFVAPTRKVEFVHKPGPNRFGEIFHDEFDERIVQVQRALSEDLRSGLAGESDVQSVHYAYVEQKPLTMKLQVAGDKILFSATGLVLKAKATARVPSKYKVLCGSSATVTVRVEIGLFGEYDLDSGVARITRVDTDESEKVNCSWITGKILDFAIEIVADRFVEDYIQEQVEPILAKTVQVGSVRDWIDMRAEFVEDRIGINFAEEAWNGLLSYINGMALEIVIGVDIFGVDQHLMAFRLFNAGVPTISYSGRTGKINQTFTCPSWSNKMTVYEMIPVKTGTRRVVRHKKDYYGARRFKKLSLSGLKYTRYAGCTGGRMCIFSGTPDPGVVVTCENAQGSFTHKVRGVLP